VQGTQQRAHQVWQGDMMPLAVLWQARAAVAVLWQVTTLEVTVAVLWQVTTLEVTVAVLWQVTTLESRWRCCGR